MSADTQTEAQGATKGRRIIKRYSNRQLYDTTESRYVTLAQIADLVRAGEEVQVIDNATKEDKTEATLALILSEEVKTRPKAVPLGTLRELVHTRGEKLISQLREGPLGRFFNQEDEAAGLTQEGEVAAVAPETTPAPETKEAKEARESASRVEAKVPPARPSEAVAPGAGGKSAIQQLVESSKNTIEHWQAAIDERIQAIMPGIFKDVQGEAKRLAQRVEELELRVKELENRGTNEVAPDNARGKE
ncbi:MAG: polyhydroxyalkanoate synthesis regulator DNA-binding domain-containing protein [Polyangiaceae bacterium]